MSNLKKLSNKLDNMMKKTRNSLKISYKELYNTEINDNNLNIIISRLKRNIELIKLTKSNAKLLREEVNQKIKNTKNNNLNLNYKFENKEIEKNVEALRNYIKTQRAILKEIDKTLENKKNEVENLL